MAADAKGAMELVRAYLAATTAEEVQEHVPRVERSLVGVSEKGPLATLSRRPMRCARC